MDRVNKFRNWAIVVFLLFLCQMYLSFKDNFSQSLSDLYSNAGKIFVMVFTNPLLVLSVYLILKSIEISRSVSLTANQVQCSAGVTIFGLLGVCGGGISLIHITRILNDRHDIFSYCAIPELIIFLILVINLLALREWARKGIIYYTIFAALVAVAGVMKGSLNVKKFITNNSSIEALFIFIILATAYTLLIIFFFTRPKVKRQFK